MNRQTSIYLDACRFIAALIVVLCHTDEMWTPGLIPFASRFGAEAVGVFFVLSGFVIAYVVDGKEVDAGSYALNRAARIYSVAVPALTLTVLIDIAGRWLAPASYVAANWGTWKEPIKALIGLTFLNQVWEWKLGIGSDPAYWSLYYEVAYYVAFGLAFFGRTLWWWLAAAVVFVATGTCSFVLFFLWLLGFGCYHLCRTVTVTRRWAQVILFAAALVWLSGECWYFSTHPKWWVQPDVRPMRAADLWTFYAGGLPFVFSILGFQFSGLSLARVGSAVHWVAGATFTLYLVHCPIGTLVHALLPSDVPIWSQRAAIWGIVLPSVFLIAEFTERRKGVWREAITWASGPLRREFVRGPA